jgi:predicted enzyme related to lactoylglutathione lyase
VLLESAGDGSGHHTQMGWEVEDIEATVEWLRARGVVFEEYDFPGLRMVNGIAEVRDSEGNLFGKGAWFRDNEGNILGINRPTDR